MVAGKCSVSSMTSSIKSTWLGAIYTVLIANDKTKSTCTRTTCCGGLLPQPPQCCQSLTWNHRITGLESTGDGKAVLSHPNSLQTIEFLRKLLQCFCLFKLASFGNKLNEIRIHVRLDSRVSNMSQLVKVRQGYCLDFFTDHSSQPFLPPAPTKSTSKAIVPSDSDQLT